MSKVFEDCFMDIQEDILATCIEALGDAEAQAETAYVYAFASVSQLFFHVFFKVKGQICSYEDLGVSDDVIDQVYDLGMDDVQRMTELFQKHNRKPPNEYKLIYQNKKHTFDSEYEYDDLESSKMGPMDRFLEWKNSIWKEKNI